MKQGDQEVVELTCGAKRTGGIHPGISYGVKSIEQEVEARNKFIVSAKETAGEAGEKTARARSRHHSGPRGCRYYIISLLS